VILRGLNIPGADPSAWVGQEQWLWSGLSFLNVSKYPPSFAFVLVTLGLALGLYLVLERLESPVSDFLAVFGRTPLLTYLAHIWIAHGLALLVGIAMGIPAAAFANSITSPQSLIEAGWGFSLPGVYLAWLVTLAMLYPLSHRFDVLKQKHRFWWMSYL
jgi:predicted acyltransferase